MNMKMSFPRSFVIIFLIFIGIILIGTISACNGMFANPTPILDLPTASATLTIAEQQPIIWNAWNAGPHAAAYDLGKGPNTFCARCHSPSNWDYASHVDPPPNCVSCKFPTDAIPRVAKGNPYVPVDDWRGIDCSSCHFQVNGKVSSEIAWWDASTGYYETLSSSTELCEKCHQDTETLRHRMTLDGVTHANFTCVNCHDPHTTNASCGSSGCHEQVVATIAIYNPLHTGITNNDACLVCHTDGMQLHSMQTNYTGVEDCLSCHANRVQAPEVSYVATAGHTTYHKNIYCVACHDASGLQVGPVDNQQYWTTFRGTEFMGKVNTNPYYSHELQKQVDCTRCHFPENPWEIPQSIDTLDVK